MIGDLYNAANVVVGQAAVLIAPENTALPTISATVPDMSDPFSLVPWAAAVVSASAAISAGTYTLTYTYNGTAYTTADNQYNDPATTVKTNILTALAPLGVTALELNVSGGPPDATTTPLSISIDEAFLGGVWTLSPTGITGGTLSVTQQPWTPVGATKQGWTWASAKTIQDITVEEQQTLVGQYVTENKFTITGALSEDITRTLALALNMTSTVTAASPTNPGYTTLTLSDVPIKYAVALIMANALGYPRWLYIPQATCLDNISTPLRRAADSREYTAQFSSICNTDLIQLYEFESLHT